MKEIDVFMGSLCQQLSICFIAAKLIFCVMKTIKICRSLFYVVTMKKIMIYTDSLYAFVCA